MISSELTRHSESVNFAVSCSASKFDQNKDSLSMIEILRRIDDSQNVCSSKSTYFMCRKDRNKHFKYLGGERQG